MRSEGLSATSIASLLHQLDRAAKEGKQGLTEGSVLLVDEAGMVDSATVARLIHHTREAQAKLVLVGDPQQLAEIGAGGMFSALALRSDPIYLDEVIRHNHEVDREAAKRIREGEGREALELYRSEQRVVVAANAQARREAMVADWQQSFLAGEDAVMVAKRNVDVARLNERARAVMREQGRLGEQEIEVGGNRFAAGDQVITRINDRQADIYNRERWRVAEVDASKQRMVLEGIDQARRVEVGADYLARTNRDAPAIEYAYAVTTYCAQGSTVDRAYVMADPSMDKQELYVAASRSREETYLYATPEIQSLRDRAEYAPSPAEVRGDLEHIVAAAQRDGSQSTAHDEALQSAAEQRPTGVLVQLQQELQQRTFREAARFRALKDATERVELSRRLVAEADARLTAVENGSRKERREKLTQETIHYNWVKEGLENGERDLESLPRPDHYDAVIAEKMAVERVLAERKEVVLIAQRLAPSPYIEAELGPRPDQRSKLKSWKDGIEKDRELPPGPRRHRSRAGVWSQANDASRASRTGTRRT